MILSEDDVRAYVREASGGKARWVEPALGSTPGLPDCWVPFGGHSVHLELKAGTIIGGMLRYKIRPEQRREILRMKDNGVPVGIVIGIKNTRNLLFCLPTSLVLNGAFSMAAEPENRFEGWAGNHSDLWSGVNFIFLSEVI